MSTQILQKMATTNDDWETLRAIYDDGGDDYALDVDDTQENRQSTNDERKLKLVSSLFPNGFCGTVYMTFSTSKIAFARLVKSDGSYRYFALAKPPILKLDLLYFTRKSTTSSPEEKRPQKNDHDDWSELDSEEPSHLRLTWDYYPSEWPTRDKEKYRSSLAKKCHSILQEEGSFSVCQFLEHDAISFYYEDCTADTTAADIADEHECEPTTNASNSWKTYADTHHPDYLLVILPPKMDQLYHPSTGTLLHPREEAAALQKIAAEKKAQLKASSKSAGKKKQKTASKTPIPRIATTLDFGRYALLQNWKDLYRTRCPICLEESMLYSNGVVLPYCQHYCCRDCFKMYLRFKVQDIKQHRTNPFLCPVESCKLELPMGYCKQFLSDEDIEAAKAWYKDLKNPPCWSLDRCLRTKTCGAVGSMRRRKGVVSIDGTTKTTKGSTKNMSSSSLSLDHLVYCESCETTWCELCLVRVYDDFEYKPVRTNKKQLSQKDKAQEDHTISNHKYNCQPQSILRFCRRYMAATNDIKEVCEAKYPWIASYSQFCQHDGAALLYILENGQRCPNCSNGVERIEGCFHMKCPTCATHFCYECGTELFAPFYGTHHCWEETLDAEDGGDDVDEQRAMAMQFMNWAPG
jgi:hypothetical protein